MKKLFTVIVVLLMSTPCFAASQWAKTYPLGTRNVSDIDTYIGINNEAIDRLLTNYREGVKITYSSAAALSITAGEVVCSNSAGTVRRFRKNTSAITTNWTVAENGLDAGAEAASTTYYIFAVADTDAETFTVLITTSSTAPTGSTYYKRLGSFYNDGSSNITYSGIVNDNNIYGLAVSTAVSKSTGTTYQALTDGQVVCSVSDATGANGFAYYSLVTDNSSSPSTVVGYISTGIAGDKDQGAASTSALVKKGDYYKCYRSSCVAGSCGAETTYMYFIPLY